MPDPIYEGILLDKGGGVYNVKHSAFGALGDGTTDDTAAIQAAIDAAAAGSGLVLLPAGTYKVSIGTSGRALTAKPGVVLSGVGRGLSVIRLKDGVVGVPSNYRAIIEPVSGDGSPATDISGWQLRDLTIDLNGTNNPVGAETDLDLGNRRCAFQYRKGTDVVVAGCGFRDIRGRNTVLARSRAVGDVQRFWCLNNTFEIGAGNEVDYDVSVIYTECEGAHIEGNELVGPASTVNGARTAIEIHGSDQIVRGNRIADFTNAVILAQRVGGEGDNVQVTGNVMTRVLKGVRIWSVPSAGWAYQAGRFALTNVRVSGNSMHLDRDRWRALTPSTEAAPVPVGVTSEARPALAETQDVVQELPSRNVVIENNEIYFAPSVEMSSADDAGAGIGLRTSWGDTVVWEQVTVRGNTIVEPLAAGVRWNINCKRGRIEQNEIVNAGQSTNEAAAWRAGVNVAQAQTDLWIVHNRFVDDQATSTLGYGIYAAPTAAAGKCRVVDNILHVAAGTVENWRGGSVHSTAFIVEEEGTAAPASGYWGVGSRVMNVAPTAGGSIGWVCTTAATGSGSQPGTWKAFGSIAP